MKLDKVSATIATTNSKY